MKTSEGEPAVVEIGNYQELIAKAETEVPAEVGRRLGCALESADPVEAERCLASLMDEYNEKQNNALRHHVEVTAKLLTWIRMAAKVRAFEKEFANLFAANDNQAATTEKAVA